MKDPFLVNLLRNQEVTKRVKPEPVTECWSTIILDLHFDKWHFLVYRTPTLPGFEDFDAAICLGTVCTFMGWSRWAHQLKRVAEGELPDAP